MSIGSVNNVTFNGRLAQTKKGNTYEKTNTGKNIGTVTGLVGGTILAASNFGQTFAVLGGLRLSGKNLNKLGLITYGIIAAGVALTTLAGRALGAIPDAIINNKRKATADKTAALNTQG